MTYTHIDAIKELNREELMTMAKMLKVVFAVVEESDYEERFFDTLSEATKLSDDPDEKLREFAQVILDYNDISDKLAAIVEQRRAELN